MSNQVTVSAEDIKRVKALGCLHNRGTDLFSCRVLTRNGKVTNEEIQCITTAAKMFGNGEIAMTTRLSIEIQAVAYEQLDALREYLAKAGLSIGGTGKKIRPIVSCKGSTCQFGLYDTFHLSRELHERFFEAWSEVALPHKFKIAVGGCPNNCLKPDLNDFGVVGQRIPTFDQALCKSCKSCSIERACPMHAGKLIDGVFTLDEALCNHCGRCAGKCPFKAMSAQGSYGYRVYIGGRWGKKTAVGKMLNCFFTDEQEIFAILEKTLLLFKEQGKSGERFSDTIERIGFESVEAQLLSDDILSRAEQILG